MNETMEAWLADNYDPDLVGMTKELYAKAREVDAEIARLKESHAELHKNSVKISRMHLEALEALQQARAERDALAALLETTSRHLHIESLYSDHLEGAAANTQWENCPNARCKVVREALTSMEANDAESG